MEKYATNHEAFLTKFKSQCDEREAGSCCCSVAKSCPTLWDPWTAAHQASLSLTISQSLPKFTSIESVMPSNHPIFCCPLLLLLSAFPGSILCSGELSVSLLCSALEPGVLLQPNFAILSPLPCLTLVTPRQATCLSLKPVSILLQHERDKSVSQV